MQSPAAWQAGAEQLVLPGVWHVAEPGQAVVWLAAGGAAVGQLPALTRPHTLGIARWERHRQLWASDSAQLLNAGLCATRREHTMTGSLGNHRIPPQSFGSCSCGARPSWRGRAWQLPGVRCILCCVSAFYNPEWYCVMCADVGWLSSMVVSRTASSELSH